MASSSIPKQDVFNPSLISLLITQQKACIHFEAQLTKIVFLLTNTALKRPMRFKRNAFMHHGNAAAPQEGAFSWQG